jgi:hypothetical protein
VGTELPLYSVMSISRKVDRWRGLDSSNGVRLLGKLSSPILGGLPPAMGPATRRLCQAMERVGRKAEPTYQVKALVEQVRGSPSVTPDETGWKLGGQLW